MVRGRLTYVPDGTVTGLPEIVSGATAAPTFAARPFAIGIFDDPALSTITYNAILDAGGKYGNTSRGKTLTIGPSDWLWTSTTSASPTTIDLRMTAFGKLYFAYFNASTTATVSFGHLIVQLDVEFKGVVYNAAALGSAMAPPGMDDTDSEEKKVSSGSAAKTLATSPRTTAAKTLIALGPSAPSDPAVPSGYGRGWF